MEDCIIFSAEIIGIVKMPRELGRRGGPLSQGTALDTARRPAGREGGTHTAASGFEDYQEVKNKLRKNNLHSNFRCGDFFPAACKPSVVRGHAKPWLPSTEPAQPPALHRSSGEHLRGGNTLPELNESVRF